MIIEFNKNSVYIANAITYNKVHKSRIGGNIPRFFEDRLIDIEEYLFYATIEHPQINNKVFSIFIPQKYELMLKDNIYPNCGVKVFVHDYTEESDDCICTNKNIKPCSIGDFVKIEKNSYKGNLIKMGGLPCLIQNEDFYLENLLSDGYKFFMQIDEDFYSDDLLTGEYPFGYGCLYLYGKYDGNEIVDIIAGFWQYS
jgi:hypothetical protein